MSQATKSTKLVLLMVFLANLVAHTAVGMTTTSTCGGNITGAASGRVTSPRYPQVYPPNIKCQWDITTNIGTGMRLVVEHLDNKETAGGISICYDTLHIYRYNPNGSASLIKILCGHSVLELTSRIIDVTSTSASTSKIAIVFTSDYATELTGFSIVYKALCNQTLEGASGTVTSPGFPSNYPRDARCTTTISTAPGTNVQLQFVDIAIHKTFLCVNDYVRVTSSTGGTGVGKPYCGNQKPNLIVSNSNDMTLEFVSDGSFGGRGFTAVWSTGLPTTPNPEPTTVTTLAPATTSLTSSPKPTTTNPSIVTSSTPTSTPPLIITTIGPLVPPETTSKIPITPTPITTGTERTATNASEPSTDAVAEAAGSTKEPLPWYPFLLIGLALLLVIIIVLVALIFARRRRKQGSQDATNDVVFQPMIEDDWTERPRENTYVEIPFLSSDEMATRNGHGPLYRSGSNASIDSIARAKRGLFEDTPTTTNNTTTTTTTTFNGGATGPPTEEPYSMALDNEGLPPNGIVAAQSPDIDDNPYQQIDYMRTEDVADIKKGSAANLVVSIPVQSASQAPAKGKKKGIRNFFGKKNAKPEPVTKKPPKVPVRTTPLRSSPESNPKSNDIRKPAVPPKNRPSIASTSQAPDVTNDDVFVPGAVGNHYQSPSSIKEKIASLNESPESEYAIASEGSFKLVEQDKPPSPSKTDDVTNKDDVGSTSENDTANKVPVPVPDSSFKVSIDPTTIDRMNGSISNDEGWYASPSSPVFEINPITSLYDRPSSLNERPQSGESYCSMSKVEAPPKPDKKSKTQKLKVKDQNGRNSGLYMQMQSQPGTHYQNLTYEKAVPSDVTAKKSDDVTK